VLERLIENWLVNAGERGFETAFAQILAAEEHRILQGPVHHPFEHGKDIITVAPNGELHAYQLKGPNLTNLAQFEEIQAQLFALAAAAVNHPAVAPARRADRVFLVTSAVMSPPVRDRIDAFNAGNAPLGLPPIQPIEREQLLGRFVAAHGQFLPQELTDIRDLLELYYADAATIFPVKAFASFLGRILPFAVQNPSAAESRRAIAASTLLTAYAVSSWQSKGNNLSAAQGWLTSCAVILHFAEAKGLARNIWLPSYGLSLEAARVNFAELLKEAATRGDLALGDLTDGLVYSARALLISGYLGAYLLSECALGDADAVRADVSTVLSRERQYVRLSGEADSPLLFTMCAALEQCGEIPQAEALILLLTRTLSKLNQRHSRNALPDPYHSTEQVLLRQTDAASDLEGEEFDGHAYTLHVAVEWLARRLWRQHLASMWSDITKVVFCEFRPSAPDKYLAPEDDQGELIMWLPATPQSWKALLDQARAFDEAALPTVLRARREFIPYLPLLFPYRLTSTLAHALDRVANRLA
jgi:hypothetical protein